MAQIRPLSAVVLAAGEGTRMRSATPKVLHPLCGRPMLLHVVDALVELPLERIVVVVGHGAERVTKTLQEQLATEMPVEFVEQRVQRGTGDAVSVGLTAVRRRPRRRRRRPRPHRRHPAAARRDARPARHRAPPRRRRRHRPHRRVPDPTGYGRIVRDSQGRVDRIVEQADATPRSSRSTRSTRRSTASAAASWRRRCAGSAPRTPRASTT